MGTGSQTSAARREPARLYLVTPPLGDAGPIADDLSRALNAADTAAVLLLLDDGEERALIERIETLRILIQSNGAALLLDGHPELVARTQADGAHLTGIEAFTAAAPGLKPKYIAGCGGLATRHDAMRAAELGADYVMFGEPDREGGRPGFEAVLDRVTWWAEVLTIPCVGYAADLAEVETLARAGADFVALDPAVWRDTRSLNAAIGALTQRVAEPAR
jgi:thiamine-phosphate pyrophosphorylase